MTTDAYTAAAGGHTAGGFSVHCTQGALGEWFTVIPRSAGHAAALRGQGVKARMSLSAEEVRRQLMRLGLPPREVDALVEGARLCSTLISAPPRLDRWSLRRLFA